MRRFIALFILTALVLSVHPAQADLSPLEITEEDASPSTFPYKVKFTNGTVTDNGDGTTSISSGGGSGITIGGTITGGTDTRVLFDDAGAIGEDAGMVFNKTTNALTISGVFTSAGVASTGSIDVDMANAKITLQNTGGTEFGWHTEANDLFYGRKAGGAIFLLLDALSVLHLGDIGAPIKNLSVHTSDTGNSSVNLPPSAIGLGEVDTTNAPSAGDFLSFSGQRFTWTAPSGSGDITSVGDVASGAAFDGTQGTVLTFNNAGGDSTLTYNGSNLTSSVTQEVSNAIPTFVWTDSGGDDYEAYADANIWYLTNSTDGAIIARTTQANALQIVGKTITEGGADLNGKIDASAATVFSFVQQKDATIVDPDTVQTTSDAIPLFEVDARNYPFGIRIVQVKVGLNASASPAYALEEWTSPTSGVSSLLMNLGMSSASEATWTTITDNTVAAGSYVFLNLDTTALNWAKVTVWFYALTA